MKFYQIGGFRSHSNRWQRSPLKEHFLYSNDLSRTLFPPDTPPPPCLRNSEGNLEMTLGIKENGSSYLLLDEPRFQDLLRHLNIPRNDWPHDKPYYGDEYISLSPMTFSSHTALNAKLHVLQPKANKKKRLEEDKRDVSRANERFGLETNKEVALSVGRGRAGFELSRTVFQAIHRQNSLRPYIQGPWDGKILGILTFALTVWPGKPPVPLDAGWAKISVNSQPAKDDIKGIQFFGTTHLKDTSKELLVQRDDRYCKGQASSFSYGETELVANADFTSKVKTLFAEIEQRHHKVPAEPVLLILHDAQKCLAMLRSLGVDTSTWNSANDLIRGDTQAGSRHASREPALGRPRDGRSRSPDYRGSVDRGRDTDSSRRDYPNGHSRRSHLNGRHGRPLFHSPTPSGSPAPPAKPSLHAIYYIDVQSLFNTILDRKDSPSLREVCVKLGICSADDGWCAGNDARYLYEAWKTMSGGSAIDERIREYHEEREDRAEMAAKIKNEAYRASKTPMPTPDIKPEPRSPATRNVRFDPLSGAEAPGLHGNSSAPQRGSSGSPALNRASAPAPSAVRLPTALADDWDAISDEEDGIPSDDSD